MAHGSRPLWRGLGALPSLTSLALGWVFLEDNRKSERIANVLDAAQVGLATVYEPC